MKCNFCKFRSSFPGLKWFKKSICLDCLDTITFTKAENDEAGIVSEVDGQKSLPAGDGGGLPDCS